MSVRIKRYGDMTGEACKNQYREIMWIEGEVGQERKERTVTIKLKGGQRRQREGASDKERERGCDEYKRKQDYVRGAVVCPKAALFKEGQGCGGG